MVRISRREKRLDISTPNKLNNEKKSKKNKTLNIAISGSDENRCDILKVIKTVSLSKKYYYTHKNLLNFGNIVYNNIKVITIS